MKLMFFILRTNIFYRNRFLRFIPEYIAQIAGNGVNPSVFTLRELKQVLNSIYENHDGSLVGKPVILIRPCPCRDALRKYSKILPNITDIIFTNNKKNYKQNKDNKFITKDELFKKLDFFDKRGLVHIVLGCMGVDGTGINICNCHKSVCFVLQAVLARGFLNGLKKGPSIAKVDPTKCKGIDECGECLSRCIFHARDILNNKGNIIEENCYGCGLCANSCPKKATIVVPRKNWKHSFFPVSLVRI
ncbi:MAG: 4Fe-4S binding protein [Candidatus Helarchaeota archaeon]|nr:4Fe-4S binding protein [Candidatus Helarchaeota archaeon]